PYSALFRSSKSGYSPLHVTSLFSTTSDRLAMAWRLVGFVGAEASAQIASPKVHRVDWKYLHSPSRYPHRRSPIHVCRWRGFHFLRLENCPLFYFAALRTPWRNVRLSAPCRELEGRVVS